MKNIIYCLLLHVLSASAQPLYLQQLEHTTTDEKQLQDTLRQIEEHRQITLKDEIFVPPFHQQKTEKPTSRKAFCYSCHLQPPHRKNERTRSFLNMHSHYISCETCHFRPENIQLKYSWLDFNKNGSNPPAKYITPFYHNEPVILFSDHKLGEQSGKTMNNGSTLEKAELKLRLHTPLSKKGPECTDCHNADKSLLDLNALGYSSKDIRKIQQHEIPRFFSRFRKKDQHLRISDFLK